MMLLFLLLQGNTQGVCNPPIEAAHYINKRLGMTSRLPFPRLGYAKGAALCRGHLRSILVCCLKLFANGSQCPVTDNPHLPFGLLVLCNGQVSGELSGWEILL